MSHRNRGGWLAFAGLCTTGLVVLACGKNPAAPSDQRPPKSGGDLWLAVKGVFKDANGNFVPGTNVRLTAFDIDLPNNRQSLGNCSGGIIGVTTLTTESTGAFKIVLHQVGVPIRACIVAEIAPPTGSGFQPAMVSKGSVRYESLSVTTDTADVSVMLTR